jgi:hypothetical protein
LVNEITRKINWKKEELTKLLGNRDVEIVIEKYE